MSKPQNDTVSDFLSVLRESILLFVRFSYGCLLTRNSHEWRLLGLLKNVEMLLESYFPQFIFNCPSVTSFPRFASGLFGRFPFLLKTKTNGKHYCIVLSNSFIISPFSKFIFLLFFNCSVFLNSYIKSCYTWTISNIFSRIFSLSLKKLRRAGHVKKQNPTVEEYRNLLLYKCFERKRPTHFDSFIVMKRSLTIWWVQQQSTGHVTQKAEKCIWTAKGVFKNEEKH